MFSFQHSLTGLAVGLLPLPGSGAEHLQSLHPRQHHGHPVGVLDVLRLGSRVAEYLRDPRGEAEVEADTLRPTLLVAEVIEAWTSIIIFGTGIIMFGTSIIMG